MSKKPKKRAEMTLEEQIRDDFEEELENLNYLYEELCDLDDETYEHFQAIKNSGAPKALSFIHLQTSNMISLKTSKINIIRDRTSIKKSIYETINKLKTDENGSASLQDQMQAMYNVIKNDETLKDLPDADEELVVMKKRNKTSKKEEDRLAQRMKELIEEDPTFLTDNEQNIKFEGKNIQIKVKRFKVKGKNAMSWKFIAVDSKNNIVKDYVLPKKSNYEMEFVSVDGEMKAVDQNERIYDIYEV